MGRAAGAVGVCGCEGGEKPLELSAKEAKAMDEEDRAFKEMEFRILDHFTKHARGPGIDSQKMDGVAHQPSRTDTGGSKV